MGCQGSKTVTIEAPDDDLVLGRSQRFSKRSLRSSAAERDDELETGAEQAAAAPSAAAPSAAPSGPPPPIEGMVLVRLPKASGFSQVLITADDGEFGWKKGRGETVSKWVGELSRVERKPAARKSLSTRISLAGGAPTDPLQAAYMLKVSRKMLVFKFGTVDELNEWTSQLDRHISHAHAANEKDEGEDEQEAAVGAAVPQPRIAAAEEADDEPSRPPPQPVAPPTAASAGHKLASKSKPFWALQEERRSEERRSEREREAAAEDAAEREAAARPSSSDEEGAPSHAVELEAAAARDHSSHPHTRSLRKPAARRLRARSVAAPHDDQVRADAERARELVEVLGRGGGSDRGEANHEGAGRGEGRIPSGRERACEADDAQQRRLRVERRDEGRDPAAGRARPGRPRP